jgi:hypothetical protein
MVRGRVVAKETGKPVAGATISLPQYGVTSISVRNGSFQFPDPLGTDDPYGRIEAVVTAPGWGPWTIRGVPLYPGDTLILNAELRRQAYEHAVLTPAERVKSNQPDAPASNYTYTCTGWIWGKVPPETVNVFITEDGVAQNYDFVFYVAHVLPNEWIPSWDADALGAGAIAAKTYGWYRAKPDHAYSEGEGCADMVDTGADQVFDPTWETSSTDQAVYATHGSILWKDGNTFLSQYYAGAPDDPCAPVEGQYAGRMSQWGTQTCAMSGMLWPDIVTTFYDKESDTEWKYLQNLLLNPGAENGDFFAWTIGSGSDAVLTRIKGGAYANTWYLQLSASDKVNVFQEPPFLGTADTPYHFETALRCGPENSADCKVTVKLSFMPAVGTSTKKKSVYTVPRDGVWRLYTFDPAAPGIDHIAVRTRFITDQTIGVDALVLTAPFGGP